MKKSDVPDTHLIYKNAERLIDDYLLLNEHGRKKSAILLQFFAMEEFGKIFLIQNGLYVEKLLHKRKQLAIASCACGHKVAEFMDKKLEQLGLGREMPKGWKVMDDIELIRSFGDGKLLQYMNGDGGREFLKLFNEWQKYAASAALGLFEYFRQVSAYYDLDPRKPHFVDTHITSDDLAEHWFPEGTAILANGMRGMSNPVATELAIQIYKLHLPIFVK